MDIKEKSTVNSREIQKSENTGFEINFVCILTDSTSLKQQSKWECMIENTLKQ